MLKKINGICRTFIWTDGSSPTRKSPIAWKSMCKPMTKGGLNLLDLDRWNAITMMELLWDLCRKTGSLWVKWMHDYFIKGDNILTMEVNNNSSWISKGILAARKSIPEVQRHWNDNMITTKFKMRYVYHYMLKQEHNVDWYRLMEGNIARPRAIFYLWMLCHKKFVTKDRVSKFGVVLELKCCFCQENESNAHLFFGYSTMKNIWEKILQWIHVEHIPQFWNSELDWITRYCNGKGKKCDIMKLAIAETVYSCWKHRNDSCFAQSYDIEIVINNIKDNIIHRGWYNRKYRDYIAKLMM